MSNIFYPLWLISANLGKNNKGKNEIHTSQEKKKKNSFFTWVVWISIFILFNLKI